jgi:hypothetical protein
MKTLHDKEIVRLCKRLDRFEADLRGIEYALRSFRTELSASVPLELRHECGLMESDSDQASAPGEREGR